jgi:hypothetical protein
MASIFCNNDFDNFVEKYEHILTGITYVCVLLLIYYVLYHPDIVINGILQMQDSDEPFVAFGSAKLANKAQHGLDNFTGFNSNTLAAKAHPEWAGLNISAKNQYGESFTGFNSNTLAAKAHPEWAGLNISAKNQYGESFTGFNGNALMAKTYPGLKTNEPFTSAVLYKQASDVPVPKYMLMPNYSIPTISSNMLEQDAHN